MSKEKTSASNKTDMTDLPFQPEPATETYFKLRGTFAVYILAVGGCLILFAVSFFIWFRYTSSKKKKKNPQKSKTSHAARPLPLLPDAEYVSVNQDPAILEPNYLTPCHQDIAGPPSLPKRDFCLYENKDIIKYLPNWASPRTFILKGNVQQLNFINGTDVKINGLNLGKAQL